MTPAAEAYSHNAWLLDEVRHRAKRATPAWRQVYDAAENRISQRLCDLHRVLVDEEQRRFENDEAAREFAQELRMDR